MSIYLVYEDYLGRTMRTTEQSIDSAVGTAKALERLNKGLKNFKIEDENGNPACDWATFHTKMVQPDVFK